MKLSETMLREWVTTTLTMEQVGDLLTMTGFEIEEILNVAGETVLDVNIMANRGDGASVLGLAREIVAKSPQARPTALMERATQRFPARDFGARDIWAKATVVVESTACTRFGCRVFEGLTNGPAPAWLQDRLVHLGQRPISLLVDLTNYVMLELGQPLHAYDLDLLQGERIVVRQAIDGEPLTTLDGRKHQLRPNHLVICDALQPVGVAGVMGGSETEVSAATTRCLLEAAHFDRASVRRTRKELGLQTEASYRFERHVDPEGVVAALNRFAELLEEATGKRAVGGVIDVYPVRPEPNELHFRLDRCDRILGMEVSPEQAEAHLTALGFDLTMVGPRKFDVKTPPWRADVLIEDDLVEEVGRVHGYELIPEARPRGSTGVGGCQGLDRRIDAMVEAALRNGLDETVSYSLGDIHPLDAREIHVQVREPHSPEIARLRNSLLPHLAAAAKRNGGRDFARFEAGRAFHPGREFRAMAALASGGTARPAWRPPGSAVADFFWLKGVLEDVLRAGGVSAGFLATEADGRFHPGRQADVVVAGHAVGVVGQLHPIVAEQSGLPAETVGFELDLDSLDGVLPARAPFRGLARNPAVRRDVSVALPRRHTFAALALAIDSAGIEWLEKWWVFDEYLGSGLADGERSLSFGLTLRASGHNLTDEDANRARDEFVAALTPFGARLR